MPIYTNVPVNVNAWVYLGVAVPAGQTSDNFYVTGSGYTIPGYGNPIVTFNANGATPNQGLVGTGYDYGSYSAIGDATVQAAGGFAPIIGPSSDPTIPPPLYSPSPIGDAIAPGPGPTKWTNSTGSTQYLWGIMNWVGYYYGGIQGGPFVYQYGDNLPGAFTLSGSFNASPTGCSASNILDWTASEYAVTYNVYKDGSLLVSGLPSSTLTYTDSTAIIGTTYTYYIKAVSLGGTTDSNTITITPLTGLTAPTVSLCQPCCNQRVYVSWNAVQASLLPGSPAATSYGLYRTINDESPVLIATVTGKNPLKFTDYGVTVGALYTYQVYPYYGCWSGPAGSATIIPTGFTVYSEPSNSYTAPPEPTNTYASPAEPNNVWTSDECNCGE